MHDTWDTDKLKVRILIAEPTEIQGEGLRLLLEREKDFEVVGVAEDGEQALKLATVQLPDVLLMDIDLPALSGIEVLRKIRSFRLPIVTIILTFSTADAHINEAILARVDAYLMMSMPVSRLIQSIRLASSGQKLFEKTVAPRVYQSYVDATESASRNMFSDILGRREHEVLKLIARGMNNRMIARELSISQRTVQSHIRNLFVKLKARSRAEAVAQSLKKGWLDISDIA